jgi:hypothetical protein
LSHNHVGPITLFALGGLLIATAAWRRWWTHRPRRDPARGSADGYPPRTGVAWRVRATVRDVPGSLAGVTAAAGRGGKGPGEGIDGTVMRLADTGGGLVVVARSLLPFTPAEFARAKAVLGLQCRLTGSRSAPPDQVPASDA